MFRPGERKEVMMSSENLPESRGPERGVDGREEVRFCFTRKVNKLVS